MRARSLILAGAAALSLSIAQAPWAAAAVPGIVDYFGTVPHASRAARQHATWHAVINGSAMLAFLLARRERQPNGETTQSWSMDGANLTIERTSARGAQKTVYKKTT